MLTGYIYGLFVKGALHPSYIGQTTRPKVRLREHSRKATKLSSGRLLDLFGTESIQLDVLEEIEAVDEVALRFLLDSGERGYIDAYGDMIVNQLPGGRSMVGEANPFYGKTHSKETLTRIKNTKRATGFHEKQRERLLGKAPWSKFKDSPEIVLYIRSSDKSNRILAAELGVHEATVLRIRQHKQYAHFGGKPYKSRQYLHGKYAKARRN